MDDDYEPTTETTRTNAGSLQTATQARKSGRRNPASFLDPTLLPAADLKRIHKGCSSCRALNVDR